MARRRYTPQAEGAGGAGHVGRRQEAGANRQGVRGASECGCALEAELRAVGLPAKAKGSALAPASVPTRPTVAWSETIPQQPPLLGAGCRPPAALAAAREAGGSKGNAAFPYQVGGTGPRVELPRLVDGRGDGSSPSAVLVTGSVASLLMAHGSEYTPLCGLVVTGAPDPGEMGTRHITTRGLQSQTCGPIRH